MKRVKPALFFAAAFCWLLFGLGFGGLLVSFLLAGAGMQLFSASFEFFMPVSSMTILIGLIYFVGLVTAALVCFAVGFGLFERALAMRDVSEN